MADDAWLVVGLGNPGPEYADTRHNVGRLVVEELASRTGSRFRAHRQARADVIEARLGELPGTRAVVARPRTYMNLSGGPVSFLCRYFDVPPERLVVVHDELDLPAGGLRIKSGGGDNGHNGLRSVRSTLGTGEFLRVRVGVGRPPGSMDPARFLLKPWSSAERAELELNVGRAADAVEVLVIDGLTCAQNHYNG